MRLLICSNRLSLFMFIAVASIVSFGSHIGLVMFPTVIYLFIYPLNTMSLIFLHISIIYCTTILLGMLIYYIHQLGPLKNKCCCCIWLISLLYFCFMFSSAFLSYITVIEFYQLVINRNVYDQFVWANLTNNIPTLLIILVTWMLNRRFLKKKQVLHHSVTDIHCCILL